MGSEQKNKVDEKIRRIQWQRQHRRWSHHQHQKFVFFCDAFSYLVFFKIAHTHFMLPLKTKYFHNSQKIDKDATHARTHKQLRAAKYYTPTKMFFNFSLNHFTNSRSIFSFTLSPSLGAAFVCNISIRSGVFFFIVIFAH